MDAALKFGSQLLDSSVIKTQPYSQEIGKNQVFIVLAAAACFPVVRYVLEKLLFRPIAVRTLISDRERAVNRISHETAATIEKFCESFWKVVVYSSLFAYGLYAIGEEPWFTHTADFWKGWPDQIFTPKLRTFYAFESAFYVSACGMLVTWEVRRSDFWVMMAHHVLALVLIVLSYHESFLRVGSLILVLHDISDIQLEAAKMLNYCKLEPVDSIMFAALMLTWFTLRLIYLPFWVIWSTSVEIRQILGFLPASVPVFNAMLALLVVLHLYWFGLMARIAVKKLLGHELQDSREEHAVLHDD